MIRYEWKAVQTRRSERVQVVCDACGQDATGPRRMFEGVTVAASFSRLPADYTDDQWDLHLCAECRDAVLTLLGERAAAAGRVLPDYGPEDWGDGQR